MEFVLAYQCVFFSSVFSSGLEMFHRFSLQRFCFVLFANRESADSLLNKGRVFVNNVALAVQRKKRTFNYSNRWWLQPTASFFSAFFRMKRTLIFFFLKRRKFGFASHEGSHVDARTFFTLLCSFCLFFLLSYQFDDAHALSSQNSACVFVSLDYFATLCSCGAFFFVVATYWQGSSGFWWELVSF